MARNMKRIFKEYKFQIDVIVAFVYIHIRKLVYSDLSKYYIQRYYAQNIWNLSKRQTERNKKS